MTTSDIDRLGALKGLNLFAPTADQRLLLGAELFLRTHFPMTLRRYRSNGAVQMVGEHDLLEKLMDSTIAGPGNRIWLLYGAAGSGKSELMTWLQTRMHQEQPASAAVMLRISRTELNVLSITERFRSMLSDGFFQQTTYLRWEAARQKPRTLTKLLLLSALENLLESDETINALFYRLLNAVQPFIEQVLATNDEMTAAEAVELMSQEAWEAIVSETAIAVPMEYEQFRYQMIEAFQNHLLEGLSLPDTLQRVSAEVTQRHGTRPILLVDDLVQSLNLFATDLLDYFITLEAGNWDVVLGLTPAAFEASLRGRRLLQRIAYLDTIDDRVEKLWLSDEAGQDSYVLTEDNCDLFAARYLAEYHSINRVQAVPSLYPFNREALVRIYRGLPAGKGKVRYFLRHLREVLEQVAQGASLLHAVSSFAQKESVARCDDLELASICELYGPLVSEPSVRQVTLPANLLSFFERPPQDMAVSIEPLVKRAAVREVAAIMVRDEEKVAVRDWLLGNSVNRQLLKGVRRGVARWLRAIQPPDLLHYDHIAKPHGVLRWQETYLDTRPPICLEGVDDEVDGIRLLREIGPVAFEFHDYATALGREARDLSAQIATAPMTVPLLHAAEAYRRQASARLETQLGMPIDELALSLYTWHVIAHGAPEDRPPGFGDDFWCQVVEMHSLRTFRTGALDERIGKTVSSLLDDLFRLRTSLYDGPRIERLRRDRSPLDLFQLITGMDAQRPDPNYRLASMPLCDVIHRIAGHVRHLEGGEVTDMVLSPAVQSLIEVLSTGKPKELFMDHFQPEVWAELHSRRPQFYAALRVRLEKSPNGRGDPHP